MMDGHDTHENLYLKCAMYNLWDTEGLHIEVICFLSKTTHKCQPLDVLVFSVMERRWQAVCKEYLRQHIPINWFTVIQAYIQGTWDTLTKALIVWAFKKMGLYPVDHGVFGLEDFAPSKALSIVAHVPPSFPTEITSSDVEAQSSDAEWSPGSDMDEKDISQRNADKNLHASEEPQPGTPTKGHALVQVPDQVAQLSEGPGNDLDATPDTEYISRPVTGFMIAMANFVTNSDLRDHRNQREWTGQCLETSLQWNGMPQQRGTTPMLPQLPPDPQSTSKAIHK
jgi:hypothetical protein